MKLAIIAVIAVLLSPLMLATTRPYSPFEFCYYSAVQCANDKSTIEAYDCHGPCAGRCVDFSGMDIISNQSLDDALLNSSSALALCLDASDESIIKLKKAYEDRSYNYSLPGVFIPAGMFFPLISVLMVAVVAIVLAAYIIRIRR